MQEKVPPDLKAFGMIFILVLCIVGSLLDGHGFWFGVNVGFFIIGMWAFVFGVAEAFGKE